MANCILTLSPKTDGLKLVTSINDYIKDYSQGNNENKLSFALLLKQLQKEGFDSLKNLKEQEKNLITLFAKEMLFALPKGTKQFTETSRNWLKGENGQLFIAEAENYQKTLDAYTGNDPQKILEITNDWIKDNMGVVESKGNGDKKEPNLEDIKYILRKNMWTCINCEANNSYSLANCEVCDTERYFSFAEVKILMQYF